MNHEVVTYLKRANELIEEEYIRITEKSKEDPGTAGDQGEENWKRLIEKWIPSYFHVVTKGRIVNEKR